MTLLHKAFLLCYMSSLHCYSWLHTSVSRSLLFQIMSLLLSGRTRPRPSSRSARFSEFISNITAARQSLGRDTRTTPLFATSFGQLYEDDVTIFDPSEIIRQSPITSFESLATRKILKAFTDLVSGSDSWDGFLKVQPIESIVSQESSMDSAKQSLQTADALDAEACWYFDPNNLKPGAPGWKLEGELRMLLITYEGFFPQIERLKLINDPSSEIPGSERLREVGRESPLTLAVAERCGWEACVLHALVNPPPIQSLTSAQVVQPTFALDPQHYSNASPEDKARLLQSMYPRFMVCHATAGLNMPALSYFHNLKLMVMHWLHMICFNGVLPEIMSGSSVPDCFFENVEDIPLLARGYEADLGLRANRIVRQLQENKDPET